MSSLTSCNFCDLKNLRNRIKGTGSKIFLRAEDGGVAVYVVPKGEKLDTSKDAKGEPSKQWRMWFMELTEHCVC
jgi:hypothetical protein